MISIVIGLLVGVPLLVVILVGIDALRSGGK